MKLDALPGNDALKRQLSAQAGGRGLSHAYLISGPRGSGKKTLARLLSAVMVCTGPGEKPCGLCAGCKKALSGIHPDITTVGGDGKDISVAQARAIRSDAYIRPNEADRKIYIVENAQNLNIPAQNALLKLLEEGPAYAAFLLLTDNPGALLPTVRSRCEGLTLAPPAQAPAQEDDEVEAAALELLERIVNRDELSLAEWCVGKEKWDREALCRLMERETALLRDALAIQAGTPVQDGQGPVRQAAALEKKALVGCVEVLAELRRAADFNVGAGHLCGALCARLMGVLS